MTRETPGLRNRLRAKLREKRRVAAGFVAAIALRGILDNTPVEDGHAHEAWIQAGEDAAKSLPNGEVIRRVLEPNKQFASGDPAAIGGATVEELTGASVKTTVRLNNSLGFVRTLEYGGTIQPIAPGGRKVQKVIRPGERGALYGPRSGQGIGFVFYRDAAGRPHFARSYDQPAGHHVGRALERTIVEVRQRGGKAKRI